MGCHAMPQQPRADETDDEDNGGADRDGGGSFAVGETCAVDNRTDRLPQIEETRMERGGGAAGGRRQLGHMDLDAPMQEVEAQSQREKNADLQIPGELNGG